MTARIMIADDHGLLRAGLRALLSREPNLSVVGEAASGDQALEIACSLRPDILLLGTNMPGMNSLQIIRRLQDQSPQMRVLILTTREDGELLPESLTAGAVGCIVKQATTSELLDAIRIIRQGQIYVHPTMMRALFKTSVPGLAKMNEPAEPLTPRERETLRYIAQGYTNRQIADQWTLSIRTVESHRANLISKLNLHGRAELVRYAMEHGYL